MSLRENAAKFGRNQTGTGIAASQAALQGGNSAAGIMGSQSAQGNAAGTGQGLLGTATGAINSMGNMGLNQMQMQQNANSASQAGLGSLLGTGMMAGAMMFASSKELKEDGHPLTTTQRWPASRKSPLSAGSTARAWRTAASMSAPTLRTCRLSSAIRLRLAALAWTWSASAASTTRLSARWRRRWIGWSAGPPAVRGQGHRIGAHPHAEQGRSRRAAAGVGRRSVGGLIGLERI